MAVQVVDSFGDLQISISAVIAAELEVKRLTAALQVQRDILTTQTQEVIPSILQEKNVQKMVTSDGWTVALTTNVHPQMTDESKPGAYNWLIDNGHGGVVKTLVTAQFAVKDVDHANEIYELLAEMSAKSSGAFSVGIKWDVNWQTLRATLNEIRRDRADAVEHQRKLIAQGVDPATLQELPADVPLEKFGTEVIFKATINPPKFT